jgi:shikimate dehydrogenase
MTLSAKTRVAGVVGQPIAHSLSPLLHNSWIAELGLDAVYVAFEIQPAGFANFIESLRGSSVVGLNITLPFKTLALALADTATHRARLAQAANVLIFPPGGEIMADNTDGVGLISAFADQAPGFDPQAGPAVILGAGGAAQGAAAAFLEAGCPQVRLVNRTLAKAQAIADGLGGPIEVYPLSSAADAIEGATVIINATSAGLADRETLNIPLASAPPGTYVMDMVYKPLITPFLRQAQELDLPTIDGLGMLIGQAVPAFAAFFGHLPPPTFDVRGLALKALGQ